MLGPHLSAAKAGWRLTNDTASWLECWQHLNRVIYKTGTAGKFSFINHVCLRRYPLELGPIRNWYQKVEPKPFVYFINLTT